MKSRFWIFLLAALLCSLVVYIWARHLGYQKFEWSGFVLVLTGGYGISALMEAVFTFPFLILLLIFQRFLIKKMSFVQLATCFYILYVLYLIVAQLSNVFIFKDTGLFDLILFTSRFQAIVPSVGAAFLAAIFSLFAYRKTENSFLNGLFIFGMSLPIWLSCIIPISLALNNIAWAHLPMGD